MNEIRTRQELKDNIGADSLIIVGKLAKEIYAARAIKRMSRMAFMALAGGMGIGAISSPFSGGLSLGLTSLAGASLTGLSSETMILAITLGGALWAVFHDYDYEFDASKPKLVLKKRR